ncbi:hypothetical protein IU459_08170 [Nocardia amamiensis]|uniref:Uncharacterized protein n=1 Tax=Nocardia amamiensis TaxID=404578 RepID=A0ABS0CLK2_9NOCA|nr:hypothetical protein [Nocardia amamiensis]MBF6297518.1 hypothetical protein [Nocardia amamiensis]
MQRNIYRDTCIECSREVSEKAGFIFNPGYSNTVVCLECLYDFYGESRGFFAPMPGNESRFAEWPKTSPRRY